MYLEVVFLFIFLSLLIVGGALAGFHTRRGHRLHEVHMVKKTNTVIPEVIQGITGGQVTPQEAVTRIISCFGYTDERQRRLHEAYVAEMIEDVLLGETAAEVAIAGLTEAASASRAT